MIGIILEMHMDDRVMDSLGNIDESKLGFVARMGIELFLHTGEI